MKIFLAFLVFAMVDAVAESIGDVFLLPPEAGAALRFGGDRPSGEGIHGFQVRRIGFTAKGKADIRKSAECVVIYIFDERHDPVVLKKMEAREPFVKHVDDNTIEVFFLARNTRFRQVWRLHEETAILEKEEGIWGDGNDTKKTPNQALLPTTTAVTPAASHPSRQP